MSLWQFSSFWKYSRRRRAHSSRSVAMEPSGLRTLPLPSGANARASQSGLAKISDAGEERESEKRVNTEEGRPAKNRLSTEDQLSPERKGVAPLDEDGQAITAQEKKSKEQTKDLLV
ncbi:hypothetical protein COCOBI_11-5060 [Coccomyxa sp. Obi]|nr:hypothetical protein COCOBI_11-5060 [Coccomyxa sp. Obi]